MIDAAIAASVKRIVPSEYSTDLESAAGRELPIVKDKVQIRDYLTSRFPLPGGATAWTSVNNGIFFDMAVQHGILGPNLRKKTAVFHDGGGKTVCTSRLADIGRTVAAVLADKNLAATENTPVYTYSAAVTERQMTALAARATGVDFGSVEDGRIKNLVVEEIVRETEEKLARGDRSGWFNYYYQVMYGEAYGGDFRGKAWNDRLGLPVMTEEELEAEITEAAKKLGVI